MKGMKAPSIGPLETLVLMAARKLGENAYGVTIKQFVEESRKRHISIGAIYTVIGRLEADGLVQSTYGLPTPTRGGRSKRIVAVTPLGAQALQQATEEFRRVFDGHPEFAVA